MVPFYHPRVFERVNLALLDLFDRVEINRYNEDGTIRKKIRVPLTIHFSKNFADFVLNTQDKPESKHTTPILGLRMGALERNPEGTTSRVFTREIYDKDRRQIVQDMRPCPWIMTYTLTAYTEFIHDHFQIMEQIIPYFNPTFNTAMKEFEFSNLKRDIIVELVSVNPQYNDELDREKARSYSCEYTFRVKFDMYAPFYIGTLIQEINNRIAISGKEIENIQNLEIEDMTIEDYERKVNEIVSVGKQLNTVVSTTINPNPDNEYLKYVDVTSNESFALVTVPAGKKIKRVYVAVIEAFNSNRSSVSIGTSELPNLLMSKSDSNLAINAKYQQELNLPRLTSDMNLIVTFSNESATVGSFEISVLWD